MRVKDTEACQMIRMHRDILRKFGSYVLLLEPVFGKTAGRKNIIYYYLLAQTAETIINFHLEFEHVQTASSLMIVEDSA